MELPSGTGGSEVLFAGLFGRWFPDDGGGGLFGGADLAVGRSAKADVVAHSLAALGVDPVPIDAGGTARALMIGDRRHDVEGAARYGIPTALVRWGYGSPEEWDSARWSVTDTTDLEGIVHDF